MRTFIRHLSDIPIEVKTENLNVEKNESLNNVSFGGISFRSDTAFDAGSVLFIKITSVRPLFEARAKVIWCRQDGEHFEVGVEFLETTDVFRIKMVEQICRIENYKKEILEKEGRALSGQEAALEWIGKYADDFQKETSKE
jgi:hypothetical protein